MTPADFLFTSESVSEGHPDKVCDRVSDEIVDLYFREALKAGYDTSRVRVACETAATTNQVALLGEMRGPDIDRVMQKFEIEIPRSQINQSVLSVLDIAQNVSKRSVKLIKYI